jgi:hypothetical protein
MKLRGATAAWLICLAGAAQPVLADWPNQNITKWVQLPDTRVDPTGFPLGMDVLATYPYPAATAPFGKILADDFLCTLSGPITDIHIWGSWLNDQIPIQGPNAALVKLSIHSDIPDPDGTGPLYSQPGQELWTRVFAPFTYIARPVGTGPELFFDPNIGQIIGTDNVMWQYNFLLSEREAFRQQQGTIYWLDVQVMPVVPVGTALPLFGWKTSEQHWNDDAVFADNPTFGAPIPTPFPWGELRYPTGHPLQGQSIDLAFALTTIPLPAALPAGGLLLVGMMGAAWVRRRRKKN